MKKIILVLSIIWIFISTNSNSQPAWIEQQTGYSFLQTLYCVKFFNSQTGIIGGHYSAFARTTNGGLNWININNNYYNNYNSLSLINGNTGWIAGDYSGLEMIRKTTNAGLSWDSSYFDANTSIRDIQFIDGNIGYLADNHYIKKSTNGGNNWAVIYDMGINFTNYSIFFLNSLTGWASSTCYDPYSYLFTTKLIKTTDGGLNWLIQISDSSYENNTCNDIQFINDNTGYISRTSLGIFKTTNGGQNWMNVQNNSNNPLFFLNENTGWVGSEYYIRKTINGGINWNSENVIQRVFFNGIFFINELTGWGLGGTDQSIPKIFKTTNGGISAPPDTLYTLYFPLNIGNVFVYDWVYSGGGGGTYKLKITKDTVINGKRYYNLSNKFPAFPGTNLVRIDSVNSNIYTYVGSGGCGYNPQEILIDSLKSKINDTSHTCLSSPENLRKCTDTNTSNIFGYQIPTKRFNEVLILSPTPKRFGKNFGLINASLGDPYPTNYTLKGCIINGVVYGDTTAPVTLYSISGTVRYTDNNQPVTSGVVKAIKLNQNDASIIVYDTALIQSNGTYILPNVPQDSVYIGLYPNSGTTPDYVISYYPSATDWHEATGLYPTSNLTNIDLGAIRIQSTTANNSVNGKVMRLTNSTIGNLKDAVLYAKNGNIFVRCSTSDVNGVYHLPSLPTGNLKIIVNRLGFSNDSTTVNVTSSSNIDSINFNLFNNYTGIKPITGVVPTDFKLYQNYPNPFNPVTKIKFDVAQHTPYPLSRGENVTLKIYDIIGREIVTLVNEKLQPGTYEVTFDGSKYASGVYFYQLRTGDFLNTKRMVMIK